MIRIAIIGTGGIAGHHAQSFSKIPGCKIVAGCDVDEKRVTEYCAKFSIPNVYTNVDALLNGCEIDAVVNATPDRFHGPISIKVIEAGKHILCEKPLALNYVEATAMVTTAKRKGVINMVNFSYRNAAVIHKAHKLIAAGKLGEIVHVDASYLQSWLAQDAWGDWRMPGWTWRLSTKHGSAGALGDIGIHLVDFASYAVGDIKSVNAHLKVFRNSIKGEKHGEYELDANDTALMQVEFANGALGMMHVTRWATGHHNTIQLLVCGTKGALRINLDRSQDKLEISTGKDLKTPTWKEISCPKTPPNAVRFIKSIRTGVNAQPNFETGAKAQKVLDACFVSNAERRWVEV